MAKGKVFSCLMASALILTVLVTGVATAKPFVKKPQKDQIQVVTILANQNSCEVSIVSAKQSSFSLEEWKWLTTTIGFIFGGPFEFIVNKSTIVEGQKSSMPSTFRDISPLLARTEYRKWLDEAGLEKLKIFSEKRSAIESLAEINRFKNLSSERVSKDKVFKDYFFSQKQVSELLFKKFNLTVTDESDDCD